MIYKIKNEFKWANIYHNVIYLSHDNRLEKGARLNGPISVSRLKNNVVTTLIYNFIFE